MTLKKAKKKRITVIKINAPLKNENKEREGSKLYNDCTLNLSANK